MHRLEPTILRFEPEAPDGAELRYFLRHAGRLLAALDGPEAQRVIVLRRARAWILAALFGLDLNLRAVDPRGVPDPIVDGTTRAHAAADESLIPTLVRALRSQP